MSRGIARIVTALGLAAGFLWLVPNGEAAALMLAHPAPCGWSFGSLATQGALGTQALEVSLVPASPSMSCITRVAMADVITDSGGSIPTGIRADGGTATVTLLFSAGEDPSPAVLIAWHAYCTALAEPVFLHIRGASRSAVYPLGESRPCAQGPGATSAVDPPRVVSPDPAIGLAPGSGGRYGMATVNGSVLEQPGATIAAGDGSATPFVGMAPAPNGGFWLATSDGGVYSYDGAGFYGSAYGAHLAAPIVGIAPTPSGHGYWLVGADGGVFSFGDATFHGSAALLGLAAPVVGMASTADGGGYWLVAADGGVFNYGDAHFYGSAESARLSAPVAAVAADKTTGGYWLAAADGGIFAFHSPFYGSAGGSSLDAPVTGIAVTSNSGGYWLVAGDGGLFTYGDAPYHGTGASLVDP